MNRRFTPLLLIVLVTGLALSACGGGGSTPTPPTRSFAVEATEFAFAPNAFNAKVGEGVAFTITNTGILEHNFVVFDPSGAEIARVVIPSGGSTSTGLLTLRAAGDYTIDCDIPGHKEAGMIARLTVSP